MKQNVLRWLAMPVLVALAAGCLQENSASALGAARGSAGPAAQAKAQAYANPLIDEDYPDPVIIRASDGYFYTYATQGPYKGRYDNVPVSRSRDLTHWERLADAMPEKPRWANQTQNFWAPHVVERNGKFLMYYSGEPNERQGLALGVAVADSPAGPFKDIGEPLFTGPGFENIDPFLFDDPATGKLYLYWGSGFKPIKVRELTADGLRFAPGSQAKDVVSPSKKPYEILVEGAWVVKRNGWYYMFYSGDNCCDKTPYYSVMVARSRHPEGPFEKLSDATGAPDSTIVRANAQWQAPGHNSIITDASGKDWIVYHAIDARKPRNPDGSVRRPMLMDRLVYRNGWPDLETEGPSSGPRPGPVLR
jgi:arabinan endo-1,5-alpha-L-arabinosidase